MSWIGKSQLFYAITWPTCDKLYLMDFWISSLCRYVSWQFVCALSYDWQVIELYLKNARAIMTWQFLCAWSHDCHLINCTWSISDVTSLCLENLCSRHHVTDTRWSISSALTITLMWKSKEPSCALHVFTYLFICREMILFNC